MSQQASPFSKSLFGDLLDAISETDDAAPRGDDDATTPIPSRYVIDALAEGIRATSEQWSALVLDEDRRAYETDAAIDELLDQLPPQRALGVHAILEGHLLHYGASRVIAHDTDASRVLLLGDYCYATGLADLADNGDVEGVAALSRLIADVASSPADRRVALWVDALTELTAQR